VSSTSATALLLQPTVGTLRVVDGARLDETSPGAIAMATPRGSAGGRLREHLFLLVHLIGPASPGLYHETCDVASRAYWSTTGSIAAALRVATGAANRHLLQTNVQSEPGQRCYGSMICAVVSGEDIFLLKAGSAWAAIRHPNWQESLLYGEEVPALGVGAAAPIRLSHTTVRAGDTMILTAPALTVDERGESVTEALGRATIDEAVDGVDHARSADDFAALVIRFENWQSGRAELERARPARLQVRDVPAAPDDMAHVPVVGPMTPPYHDESRRARPAHGPGVPIGERIGEFLRPAGRWIGRSARQASSALVAAAPSIVRASKTWLRQLLPGGEPSTRTRKKRRRPVPPENRTAMIIVAAAIPVILAVTLGVAWSQFGHNARFTALVNEAQQEAILAQAAGGITPEARPHWERVLEVTKEAGGIRPDDPTVISLREQAYASLDRSYGIVRLSPVLVHDLGPGNAPRQILVRGQTVLVLDPADGWVAELVLDADNRLVDADSPPPMLLQTGQQIGHETVGDLVDLTWADLVGGRQTSGVVILEAGGWTINFDPSWTGADGQPRLIRTRLGAPPAGQPLHIGSYEGKLYVLDPAEEQIWRYIPSGDAYPTAPESYFGGSLPVALDQAIDMTIDGNIYLLYEDGTIRKFFGGQAQSFEVHGLPDERDLSGAVAIAADPSGRGRQLFVADQANQRVVRLSPTGAFEEQYHAAEGFSALEALAMDETAGRLYTISEGQLFVAALP